MSSYRTRILEAAKIVVIINENRYNSCSQNGARIKIGEKNDLLGTIQIITAT